MGFFSLKIQHVLFALKSEKISISVGKIHFVLQETQLKKQSIFLQNEKKLPLQAAFQSILQNYFITDCISFQGLIPIR